MIAARRNSNNRDKKPPASRNQDPARSQKGIHTDGYTLPSHAETDQRHPRQSPRLTTNKKQDYYHSSPTGSHHKQSTESRVENNEKRKKHA